MRIQFCLGEQSRSYFCTALTLFTERHFGLSYHLEQETMKLIYELDIIIT